MILKDGNSDFNFPKIDPYFINFIQSETIGSAANFVLKSSIKDMNVLGFGNTQIKRMQTKFGKKNFAIRAEAEINSLKLVGQYSMNGKLLVLPIDGNGNCNITMIDPKVLIEIRGKLFEKDGESYMNTTSFGIDFKPRKAHFYFENLFRNDKKLSVTINAFMNENWQLVVDNLIPGYEKRLGEVFQLETNKIFNNVPMKKIFRD